MEELRIGYEYLKKIHQFPQDHIRSYFNELINEIWNSFLDVFQYEQNDEPKKQSTISSYFEMIDEIKLFEQKCLFAFRHFTKNLDSHNEAIESIESIEALKKKNDANMTQSLCELISKEIRLIREFD